MPLRPRTISMHEILPDSDKIIPELVNEDASPDTQKRKKEKKKASAGQSAEPTTRKTYKNKQPSGGINIKKCLPYSRTPSRGLKGSPQLKSPVRLSTKAQLKSLSKSPLKLVQKL